MNEQEAKKLVEKTFKNSFSKERFTFFVKNFLNEIDQDEHVLFDASIPNSYEEYVKSYERIGQYTDPEGKMLDVLSVNLRKETSPARARTMQRNFVGWYLRNVGYSKDNALVAFHHENADDGRFSYVKRDYISEKDEDGKINPREEFTPAKRFSFLVGAKEPNHTAQNQIVPILTNDKDNPRLPDIETAFNIETVTNEFFGKYRDLSMSLEKALNEIMKKDSEIKADFEGKGISAADFAKKVLSQIVFLYFLQKKGWFGIPKGQDWGSGSKSFLRELFERHEDYENFFNDILEPLFYEALGRDRGKEDYYSRFKCRIPFLNGGLFEPINNYDWVNTEILLSDEMFSNSRKTSEGDKGNGILDIFDRYNFTVKEDEPLEKEVAVDPEMLGKVFENLLEAKDRKSKGTYYTPREIVHYMCQETLINYLETELHSSVSSDNLEKLIKYGESGFENGASPKFEGLNGKKTSLPDAIEQNAEVIDQKLASVRICDPAVGSGAFVVGMMTEIVRARNILTPYLQPDPERIPYNFKRDAIRDCLYGVDIDPGAVEIARLRLWLSLIVDEQDRKRIRPLPNLDYKIIQGNSLLQVEKNLFNWNKFEELEKLKFLVGFDETIINEKPDYKEMIERIILEITNQHKEFDFEVYFSEVFRDTSTRKGKKGFDIVIGNPPYVQLQKMKGEPIRKKYQEQRYETYESTGDIYCLFYEKGINITCNEGVLCYISSNKWMRTGYGKKLREFFLKYNPKILIDLGPDVFKTATVDTNILIVQKDQNLRLLKGLNFIKNDGSDISSKVKKESIQLPHITQETWFIGSETEVKLKQKIERIGKPLKEWDISIYYGIKTGCNEAFIIGNETKEELVREDPKSAELIKPILRGKDISRYKANWGGLWLIDTHNGYGDVPPVNVDRYKSIKKHLDNFYPELKKRQDKGVTPYNLRNCAYHEEFLHDKIVYPNMTTFLPFALLIETDFIQTIIA